MKALNGHFDFASAPKQGTTATLTLPIGPRATTIISP
jgi:signal transduction histidine kinase